MPMTLENLCEEFKALPLEQRWQVVDQLYDSLIAEEDAAQINDDDPELTATLLRRIKEFESGQVKPIPAELVFAELDRKFP